jgi:uncharacterized protein YkwD
MSNSMTPSHRLRPLAAFFMLVALLLPAAAGASARYHRHQRHHRHHATHCRGANIAARRASRALIKRAVVCLINQQRRAHGLPALRDDRRLDRSAQRWTNTMATHREFTHGTDFAGRISAAGLNWGAAGENIASGFSTPRQVVDAWMASPGHCMNILSPQYSLVGTGVVSHGVPPAGHRGATWTQDFARPMNARQPSGNWGAANGCPYHVH